MDPKTLSVKWNNLINTAEDFLESGLLDRERMAELPSAEELTAEAGRESVDIDEAAYEQTETEIVADENICKACGLNKTDRQLAGGEGNRHPRLCLLLDPPDHKALAENRPLSSAARDFLGKWMTAIGLDLEKDCYQLPVLLCRTPGNRPPYPEELDACRGRVIREIAELNPSAMMVFGNGAATMLTGSGDIASLRQKLTILEGIPTQITFSPDTVLNHPELKRSVWEDLKRMKEVLDEPSLS